MNVSPAVSNSLDMALRMAGLSFEDFASRWKPAEFTARRFVAEALTYRNTFGNGCCTSWPEIGAIQGRASHGAPLSRHHRHQWILDTPEWRCLEQKWRDCWAHQQVPDRCPEAELVVVMLKQRLAMGKPKKVTIGLNGVVQALAAGWSPQVIRLGQFSIERSGDKPVGVRFMPCHSLMEAIGARTPAAPTPPPPADASEPKRGAPDTAKHDLPDVLVSLPAPVTIARATPPLPVRIQETHKPPAPVAVPVPRVPSASELKYGRASKIA